MKMLEAEKDAALKRLRDAEGTNIPCPKQIASSQIQNYEALDADINNYMYIFTYIFQL